MADAKTLALMVNLNGKHAFKSGAVVFYHDNSIADAAIRIGEGGYFSHVGVALGDGHLLTAIEGKGVCYTSDFVQIVDIEARELPDGIDSFAFINLLVKQVGKPYDFPDGWLAELLWRLFRRAWFGGPPASFTCSSLVGWGLLQFTKPEWTKPVRSLTPQDIWNFVNR